MEREDAEKHFADTGGVLEVNALASAPAPAPRCRAEDGAQVGQAKQVGVQSRVHSPLFLQLMPAASFALSAIATPLSAYQATFPPWYLPRHRPLPSKGECFDSGVTLIETFRNPLPCNIRN